MVDNGGDAAVRVDLEEPRLLSPREFRTRNAVSVYLLDVCRNVKLDHLVRDAEFFQGNGDFDAVGRACCACSVTTQAKSREEEAYSRCTE